MKYMLSKRLALFALCLASASGMAASDDESFKQAAGAALLVSGDTENFSIQQAAVEYLPKYKHAELLTGFRYTTHHFEQNDWQRSGQQVTFLHRNIVPATANGWQMGVGLFHQGGHNLLTVDGNYRVALGERTGLELFINQDWVKTATALNNGTHFTFPGLALEQGLGSHITLVGLGGQQNFSDGNSRTHGRFKLIVQPNLDLGMTLQARYRTYTSSSEDVGGAYFNPSGYEEAMLALGWRQKVHGWNARLTVGTGQQKVAGNPRTPTRLLEVGIQSPLNRTYSLRLHGGLNQSASFNGPDYRYNYLQIEWIAEL